MAHIRPLVILCLLLIAIPQLAFASKSHVVRKSESLHSIARKYHVSVDELKSANNLTAPHIAKGMRLVIPANESARQKKSPSLQQDTYKVVKGDTLPKIAKKTGISSADIRSLNKLKGSRLKTGQVLVLVAPETPQRFAAANRFQLVNRDLLNQEELTDTLAELTDMVAPRPVDLARDIEAKQNLGALQKSAYSLLDTPYVFGGNGARGLDCSSFTQKTFRVLGVQLPRTAQEQFHVGNEVMRGDLKKGDLVFFQTYKRGPSHVGIYLGNRKMIHASSREHRVVISSMDIPYYLNRYLGARRMSNTASDTFNFNELMLGAEEENETSVLTNNILGISLDAE